jgi:hypothetical protein
MHARWRPPNKHHVNGAKTFKQTNVPHGGITETYKGSLKYQTLPLKQWGVWHTYCTMGCGEEVFVWTTARHFKVYEQNDIL